MGDKNSSKTRVAPAFSALIKNNLVKEFFGFINGIQEDEKKIPIENVDWDLSRMEIRYADGGRNTEKALPPPRDLLYWMVLNAGVSNIVKPKADEKIDKRCRLFKGDENVRQEALHMLSTGIRKGRGTWPVLEGDSYPDAFIETNKFVLVVEGKRTESGATRHTTYLDGCDQLLRHMDCAYELVHDKPVYGISICELEQEQFGAYSDVVLPHRTMATRKSLRKGYLKGITWRELQQYFYEKYGLNFFYIKTLKPLEYEDLTAYLKSGYSGNL